MRILLQFPEGLKHNAIDYAKKLKSEGHEVFISASPSFGACDLAISEARKLKVDKLIHFGHAEFHKVKEEFEIEYVEYKIDAPLNIIKELMPLLKPYKKIAIVTTVQHIHQLPLIKDIIEREGKSVIIGKPFGFAKYDGQILGCDVGSAARVDSIVDAHVYFGGGLFHPIGAVLNTSKPFFAADPFVNKIERIDELREKYKKKSRGKILSSIDAKNFGILVSIKNGQYNVELAKILKKRIEELGLGLNAEILVSDTFDFISLGNMLKFDVFVNTACPRIAIDDDNRIKTPILSANELIEVLELKKGLKDFNEQNNKT
ncbi:MAG: diphthamide biosynthesis enzyme Dph2 [Candidatus Micrarchaeia archaeon]